jgi:hypothetical protein
VRSTELLDHQRKLVADRAGWLERAGRAGRRTSDQETAPSGGGDGAVAPVVLGGVERKVGARDELVGVVLAVPLRDAC